MELIKDERTKLQKRIQNSFLLGKDVCLKLETKILNCTEKELIVIDLLLKNIELNQKTVLWKTVENNPHFLDKIKGTLRGKKKQYLITTEKKSQKKDAEILSQLEDLFEDFS